MSIVQLVAPIYIIVFIGWWVRRNGLYTAEVDDFITFITYRFMLPLSIFSKIATAEMAFTIQTAYFFAVLFSVMVIYFFVYQALFKQHSFEAFVNTVRGNGIYLGFPVMIQLLPAEILPLGMVLASALSPATIFGIEMLRGVGAKEDSATGKANFLKNPLVQALGVGLVFYMFSIWHPLLGELVSGLTKPLMFLSLLIVGANFRAESLRDAQIGSQLIIVLFNKLIILPLLFYGAAVVLDFNTAYTVVGVILFAMPGAVSNFIILKEMKADSQLTVTSTLVGTAVFLALLPALSYLTQSLL